MYEVGEGGEGKGKSHCGCGLTIVNVMDAQRSGSSMACLTLYRCQLVTDRTRFH